MTMTGNPDGPMDQAPMICTLCGEDLSARVKSAYHATAIIAHALDGCRENLKRQLESSELRTEEALSMLLTVLKAWSDEGVKNHDELYDKAERFAFKNNARRFVDFKEKP